MEYVIIVYKGNWADEFDVESFVIMTVDSWEYVENKLKLRAASEKDFEEEVCFGTNEWITVTAKEFLEDITVEPISETDSLVIESYLGEEFGTVSVLSIIDNLIESFDDEE
jgi:hypothetical protein